MEKALSRLGTRQQPLEVGKRTLHRNPSPDGKMYYPYDWRII